MGETKVVNIKKDKYDIYIGRPSSWGNPFIIGIDGNRKEVIEKYRVHVLSQPALMRSLHILKGKILGCHCKPLRCHGDILIELIQNLEENSKKCSACGRTLTYLTTIENKKWFNCVNCGWIDININEKGE